MFRIVEKVELAPKVIKLKVLVEHIAKKARPGQFVILRPYEEGERIPITIADTDPEEGTITLLIQEVGKTTSYIGRIMKEGDCFPDVVGPLGLPSHIEKFGTVVGLGGGFGIAALHPIVRALKEAGNYVISIIGARSKHLLIMKEEMDKASSRLLIATDDGSEGYHGFVTEVLKKLIDEGMKIDYVISIGPVPMMQATANITRPYGIKTIVSLNPIMVDGTGMCGACRVSVGGRTKFACVDGPEFDAHEVDFDLLVKRQKMYVNEERIAMEEFIQTHQKCYEGGR